MVTLVNEIQSLYFNMCDKAQVSCACLFFSPEAIALWFILFQPDWLFINFANIPQHFFP